MAQLDHRRALRSFHAGMAKRDMSSAQIAAADAWIDKRFSFMVPDEDDDVDLAWVLERSAAAVRRFDADVLVNDPWNEMDHVRPPDMNLIEYTGFAIKQFKKFARKHRVHLIVVAHPAKLQRSRETGRYPTPSLYDISDSAHWANKPGLGTVVRRESLGPEGTTSIKVAKGAVLWRDRHTGRGDGAAMEPGGDALRKSGDRRCLRLRSPWSLRVANLASLWWH